MTDVNTPKTLCSEASARESHFLASLLRDAAPPGESLTIAEAVTQVLQTGVSGAQIRSVAEQLKV